MVSSVLTNTAALQGLQNLSTVQKALATVQSQVSTGLRIADPSDNEAYWSISKALQSQAGALSAVTDALNISSSVLTVATTAVTTIMSLIDRMKQDLVTAQQPGTSRALIQTDIVAQQQSIIAVLDAASFDGVNLLDGSTGDSVSFLTSYKGAGDGPGGVTTVSLSTAGGFAGSQFAGTRLAGYYGLLSSGYLRYGVNGQCYGQDSYGTGANFYQSGGVLSFDITAATPGDLGTIQRAMDTFLGLLSTMAAQLGTVQTVINAQQSYVTSLSNALTSGAGALVDADMNVASTRLQALQTQQKLSVQALSIANGNSRLILKLFDR